MDPKYDVEIVLGGRVFSLAFTIGARRRLETHFGVKLADLFSGETDILEAPANVQAFFWAMLHRSEPRLSLHETVETLDRCQHHDLALATAAILKAMQLDSGVSDAVVEGEARP